MNLSQKLRRIGLDCRGLGGTTANSTRTAISAVVIR